MTAKPSVYSGYKNETLIIDAFSLPLPMSSTKDDTFELFDLRVEVLCPPGEKILCGAHEGDHFILHGEMLYLPPGQGISIYSLSGYNVGRIHPSI